MFHVYVFIDHIHAIRSKLEPHIPKYTHIKLIPQYIKLDHSIYCLDNADIKCLPTILKLDMLLILDIDVTHNIHKLALQ